MCINIVNTREALRLGGGGCYLFIFKVQPSKYLVFSLSVNISYGGVGVEGRVGMVPAQNAVPSGSQRLRGLRLGHRIHLALQACAEAVARLCCTNLLRKPPDG